LAVGLAVARRCVLRPGFGEVFPNPYYLWVAPTTYYHKSTGLNAITDMMRDTVPHLLLPPRPRLHMTSLLQPAYPTL
jgi:hypothetical protein